MACTFKLSLQQTHFCMQSNDPLHGKTLESILIELENHFGWEKLGSIIKINCFISNPSINSSLKFLRKTPWARKKVEELYIKSLASNKKG
jgi:uncharacterized protein (DUF2132 family)